jgi:His/Glu/Gln/Arg/opine family amino acid ABC transporter permease subunit
MDLMHVIKYLIPLLSEGFAVTIYLSLLGLLFSLLVGLVIGTIRYLRIPIINWLAVAYIDLFRGLPFLLVLYIIFYLLPFVFGLMLPKLTTAVLCLTLHTGAYFAEIVRGSLDSVTKGQTEAALSLGLSNFQRLRYVVFPQAYKISLPPLAGQTVLLIKYTSQVSLIGIMEVTRVGKVHMQVNHRPFLTFALVAIFYFSFCYPMVRLSDWLETRSTFERRE